MAVFSNCWPAAPSAGPSVKCGELWHSYGSVANSSRRSGWSTVNHSRHVTVICLAVLTGLLAGTNGLNNLTQAAGPSPIAAVQDSPDGPWQWTTVRPTDDWHEVDFDDRQWITEYTVLPLTDDARKVLKSGENLLAVHCHQNGGGQFIDVHLINADNVADTFIQDLDYSFNLENQNSEPPGVWVSIRSRFTRTPPNGCSVRYSVVNGPSVTVPTDQDGRDNH